LTSENGRTPIEQPQWVAISVCWLRWRDRPQSEAVVRLSRMAARNAAFADADASSAFRAHGQHQS
jgi:hypothetical protein